MFEDIVVEEEIEWTREQKTIVYVLKMLNELAAAGFLTGGEYTVSEKGLKVIEDFEPTTQEIDDCIGIMKQQGMIGEPH